MNVLLQELVGGDLISGGFEAGPRSGVAASQRAYAQRDSERTEMKSSPRFRSLHSDPRWGAFLKKMRLED